MCQKKYSEEATCETINCILDVIWKGVQITGYVIAGVVWLNINFPLTVPIEQKKPETAKPAQQTMANPGAPSIRPNDNDGWEIVRARPQAEEPLPSAPLFEGPMTSPIRYRVRPYLPIPEQMNSPNENAPAPGYEHLIAKQQEIPQPAYIPPVQEPRIEPKAPAQVVNNITMIIVSPRTLRNWHKTMRKGRNHLPMVYTL